MKAEGGERGLVRIYPRIFKAIHQESSITKKRRSMDK